MDQWIGSVWEEVINSDRRGWELAQWQPRPALVAISHAVEAIDQLCKAQQDLRVDVDDPNLWNA